MTQFLSEITGDRIEQWAETAIAPTALPDLVRRLLLTTAPLDHLNMPADGGAWRGGFDGVAIARASGAFWPAAASVWEISVSKNIERKLTDDYAKRTLERPVPERQRTAYVAVTGRRFTRKLAWSDTTAANKEWDSVRVLDADDLAAWLTLSPSVGVWFAGTHLGIPVAELADVDSYLRAWSQRTQPPLPPRLALSRRTDALTAFRARLEGPPAPIRVAADTREEAVVFAAAAIALDSSPLAERRKLRAVVVHTESALRWAVHQAKTSDAVLLPTFLTSAIITGYGDARVLVPLDREAADVDVDVRLGPIRRQDILTELVAMGVAEDAARRFSLESEGRLGVLQRLLGYGYVERPVWTRDVPTREVLVMLLVGEFVTDSAGDREVFEALGSTAQQVEEVCKRLQHAPGAPIVWKAGAFGWASHRDAWNLLARELTSAQIGDFMRVAERVLGEDDPGLDLPVNERFTAVLQGKTLLHSGILRSGVARTVARLAHSGDVVANGRGARLAERERGRSRNGSS